VGEGRRGNGIEAASRLENCNVFSLTRRANKHSILTSLFSSLSLFASLRSHRKVSLYSVHHFLSQKSIGTCLNRVANEACIPLPVRRGLNVNIVESRFSLSFHPLSRKHVRKECGTSNQVVTKRERGQGRGREGNKCYFGQKEEGEKKFSSRLPAVTTTDIK